MSLIDALLGARVVNLGQPFHWQMPQHPFHPQYLMSPFCRVDDFRGPEGGSAYNEVLILSGHTGTHIDALAHSSCNGLIHGGVEPSITFAGAARGGVEEIEPIVRRGVLLDVARVHGNLPLPDGYRIGAVELQDIAREGGIDVRAGDVVLVRTGRGALWGMPERYFSMAADNPGIDDAAAAWLEERGVAAVGADNVAVEALPVGAVELPVHRRLLVGAGIPLLENLLLEELAHAGAHAFGFVCLPLPLRGASGSPVRPVALVPEL